MPPDAAPLGRPRDPKVDERITRAAVQAFGRDGWARFSIDAVARSSGVGKQSIYLRWHSKEDLLADALTARVATIADADTGSLRGDLARLAHQIMDLYLGDWREAVLRMSVEAPHIPGVRRRWEELRESQVLAARAMVRRGIERGEVPGDTSVTLLLDALCGGVVIHTTTTPDALEPRMRAKAADYVEELVEFLLTHADRPTRP
jgi:AcrR family transcriptional regulator